MSDKALARIAGVLYLLIAVLGGFSEYVRTSASAGNPAQTAASVAEHATLFRISFAADLTDLVCFLAVGLILYVLFKPVNAPIALAMLVINAVSVPIQALNMLNHGMALLIATDPGFTAGVTVAAALEMHRLGYLIAQIFFGLYLLPLGYLVYKSHFFPRALGVVLMIGCAGYLLGVAVSLGSEGFTSNLATPFGLVGGLAETVFLVWLLVRGPRPATTTEIKGELQWSA